MTPDLSLPVDLYSPDQLSAVMIELGDHVNALRDAKLRARISHAKDPAKALTLSAPLLGLLQAAGVAVDDLATGEQLLARLETLRAHAPVARLTLAALPDRDLKRQLTAWFRTQLHPHLLLTFSVRSDIGGGLLLQVGSHFYDLSFRKMLLARKQRIGEFSGEATT